jgi:hypothetical protein
MEKDQQQELTNNDIIALLNVNGIEDDEGSDSGLEKTDEMSRSEGIEALKAAVACV